MPLRGEKHSDLVSDEAPYFRSLPELDAWFTRPHDKLSGILPYQPRPRCVDGQSDSGAKLLVCHDYKGGYTETPSGLCYTFNFWPLCDTFVYFSHHRVAVPPSGWTNSAHRHGTRMLGTLIFEGDSDSECIQLIVGRTNYEIKDKRIPVSRRYATLFAELAYQRGFDGYLLNFESDLSSQTNHARALAAWILLLRAELRAKVGPHSQVMWYDSVVYDGSVWYQNRLNGLNLPFFLPSDTLFTNYWWVPKTQEKMLQYFEKLQQLTTNPSTSMKTLQSVHSGVDVWPDRGQYGNSGYCCYRAITYTAPLGFSTALFAPGWTWESKTEDPEQNWNNWWDNERRLWLGPLKPGEIIPVPDSPEGPFKPMTAFFQTLPPPNPSSFVFHTSFSPGVGYSWFVEGKKVLETEIGWTDIDKQSSLGNLVWPWPTPSWQDAKRDEAPPTGSTKLDMTDGYNGGNTLKLTLEYYGSKSDITAKYIWLPVQSLVVAASVSFEARVIYKATAGNDVDIDASLYVKSLSGESVAEGFTIDQAIVSNLPHGWTQQTINFTSTSSQDTTSVAIGFLVGFKSNDASAKVTFSLSLGQLVVYPTPPSPPVSIGTPSVTWAAYAPASYTSDLLQGVLTWDTATTFDPIDVQIEDPETIIPAWRLHDTPAYRFPAFVYFNIYAESLPSDNIPPADPTNAIFIGTTGLDGRGNRFHVERALFPDTWNNQNGIRFYVQGMIDRGEVLPWDRCAVVGHWRTMV